MTGARWEHDDSRCQWVLRDDAGNIGATIADEAIPPAEQWDDRPAPVEPWRASADRPEPSFEMIPGFRRYTRQRFGLELPEEAKP